MNRHHILITILCFLSSSNMYAQSAKAYLDINNVKATILNCGDMFIDPLTYEQGYEFPKGSGKHSMYALGIWVSSYDSANQQLRVSAQSNRFNGSDYWAGPIDSSLYIHFTEQQKWDKIWKIEKASIDSFIGMSNHTLQNTPASILDWPAIGNPYAKDRNNLPLPITKDLAPFVDVNNDGIYNPLNGDYPQIKGDQALWWVFNDAVSHTNSNGMPLGLEIHAMAYACTSNDAFQNITFYNYNIINRRNTIQPNTKFALNAQFMVGSGFDDYMGTNAFRRMAYGYNSSDFDAGSFGYGYQLTQTACVILRSPLDKPSYRDPMHIYTHKTSWSNITFGPPLVSKDFRTFMNGQWKDSTSIRHSCDLVDTTAPAVNYVYSDDPLTPGGFSQMTCNLTPGTINNAIITSGKLDMVPNQIYHLDYAIVNTPPGTVFNNINLLKNMVDTALMLPDGCNFSIPLQSNSSLVHEDAHPYPNPGINTMFLQANTDIIKNISLRSVYGQILPIPILTSKDQIKLDISGLPSGIYILFWQEGHHIHQDKIIKRP